MRASRTLALAATLSLALAACGGGDGDDGDTGDTGGDEAATEVTLDGTDSLAFEPTSLSVAADEEVSVTLNCGDTVEHNLIIEGYEEDAVLAECAAGGSGDATVTVEAGDYTFYCNIPGHREAGMEGTLTAS